MIVHPVSHSKIESGFSISLSPSIVTSILLVWEGAYKNGEIRALLIGMMQNPHRNICY